MNRVVFSRASVLITVVGLGLAACSEAPEPAVEQASMAKPEAVSEAPAGRLGDAVAPAHYRIELRVDPREERFSGSVEIDVVIAERTDHLWLHGKNLEVSQAWLSRAGAERVDATYEQHLDSGVALLSLAQAVEDGPATLHFEYTAPFNTATNGLFKVVRGEGDAYAVTQFEPTGARQAIPSFDEPAFKVPFDLAVIAREGEVAITTTPEVSSEPLGDGFVRHTFETTRPLPTYLLAFAIGPYDLEDYGMIPANAVRDREVPLRGVAARGLGERMQYALENTSGILTVLEEYFGTPYPYRKLDLIAVPESFGGAMENPGAITYDEYLMLMDEESPLQQRRAYTAVHAHELAHQWFGNLVTPEWWNDLWLNEAFATWMASKTADAYWAEGQFDRNILKGALGAMGNDSLAAARQIREPVDHNDKIEDAFDGITYSKGGGVLSMLERYVGEDKFRDGLRLHMDRHQDGIANAENFIASIAEASGHPEIDAAFRSFVEQPGVPLVSAQVVCGNGGGARLEVSQGRYAPLGSSIDPGSADWLVPMCVSYSDDGEQKSTCAMLRESKQTIELESESCPTGVHPNADGTGYYRFALDETWWSGLIADAAEMEAAEALVMADSMDAAFRAGMVSAETWVAGMAALVAHPTWDVADSATQYLEAISSVMHPDQLEAAQSAFREIVGPRYAQLEGATDPGSAILRQRMQRFLIVIALDEQMRAPLAEQAAAYIGLNGEPDSSAAPVDQLETIFSIGVQDLGEPFFDLLLEQTIASEDPAFRNAGAGALARVEDPDLVKKLQDSMLAGNFRGTEFSGILGRQMVRTKTTEATYAFVRENDETVIGMIPEFFRGRNVAGLGSSFCTAERAGEWEAFIHSHADKLPGYERSLAQVTERIQLCAALRSAAEADLVSAFEKYSS